MAAFPVLATVLLLLLATLSATAFQPTTRSTRSSVLITTGASFHQQSRHHHQHNSNNHPISLLQASSSDDKDPIDPNRRKVWAKFGVRAAQVSIASALAFVISRPAWAMSRSRSDGYAVQKTKDEWKEQLSPLQYEILREGGTENPYFSVLENEERAGAYECVGCGTPLFESAQKFHSGTGWPSFALGLPGVQVDQVDPITANLAGAELRCATCGGHLGDVFRDGWIFPGTPAAASGRRYCIDGAALVFKPTSGEESVRGDLQQTKSKKTMF